MCMNELTEFEKLRLFFDKIGIKYKYEEHSHTNQMKFFLKDLYLWDVIDLKRTHYIELMVHNNENDEVYEFNTAKEYIQFILSYFSYTDW